MRKLRRSVAFDLVNTLLEPLVSIGSNRENGRDLEAKKPRITTNVSQCYRSYNGTENPRVGSSILSLAIFFSPRKPLTQARCAFD
jgi:hypothetical protein